MKHLVTLLVIAAAVSVASAAPVLTWDKASVGGFDVYTMGVQGDQGPSGWYLDAVFTATGGEFNQGMAYSAMHVDTLTDALIWDANAGAGYEMDTDTWYYDDHFLVCAGPAFDIQGTSTILIGSLGSIAGDLFESADMIQFAVTPGTTINWVGVLSYAGADTAVEGSIPEPMTLSLLAIGGLALIRRRK